MKKFKAVVKDKETKKYSIIESEYATKEAFVSDLRANGYSIYKDMVAESCKFDERINRQEWEVF